MFNKKDKELRKAVKKLCYELGISYEEDVFNDYKIRIGEWSYIEGGNLLKRPLKREDLDSLERRLVETRTNLLKLMNYLELEVCGGGELKKVNKPKK